MDKKTNNKVVIILVLFIIAIIFFLSRNVDNSSTTQPEQQTPTVSNNSTQTDALSMMATVFEGNYNRAEIKEKIDSALSLYKTEITEENYSRAGSSLVELRKTNGVEEMKILNCMITGYTPNVNITFPQMAALCVTELATK
jgi:ABC-type Fe3+-hydroxamate transport system substrate-binding protein